MRIVRCLQADAPRCVKLLYCQLLRKAWNPYSANVVALWTFPGRFTNLEFMNDLDQTIATGLRVAFLKKYPMTQPWLLTTKDS